MGLCFETRAEIAQRILTLTVAIVVCPVYCLAVERGAPSSGLSANSINGLMHKCDNLVDESAFYKHSESPLGTATSLGDGCKPVARPVVQWTGGYGTLTL